MGHASPGHRLQLTQCLDRWTQLPRHQEGEYSISDLSFGGESIVYSCPDNNSLQYSQFCCCGCCRGHIENVSNCTDCEYCRARLNNLNKTCISPHLHMDIICKRKNRAQQSYDDKGNSFEHLSVDPPHTMQHCNIATTPMSKSRNSLKHI